MGALHKLGMKHKVGKANPGKTFFGRNYFDVYERYFAPMKNLPINILEIGVLGGKSLRVWAEYFPKARIIGLDIDPACAQQAGGRIKVITGSQIDPATLGKVIKAAGSRGYDIIIDDGSHVVNHIMETHSILWPELRSGGVYALEDLKCSYMNLEKYNVRKIWPGMKYNPKGEKFVNDRQALELWLNGLIKDMDYRKGDMYAIHMWHELAIMLKG